LILKILLKLLNLLCVPRLTTAPGGGTTGRTSPKRELLELRGMKYLYLNHRNLYPSLDIDPRDRSWQLHIYRNYPNEAFHLTDPCCFVNRRACSVPALWSSNDTEEASRSEQSRKPLLPAGICEFVFEWNFVWFS
jgi:hypothetical protein